MSLVAVMAFNTKITSFRCTILGISASISIVIAMYALFSQVRVYNLKPKGSHASDHKPPFPDSSNSHIHWFMQVSDIHVSKFYDLKRGPDFKRFVELNIQQVIKPEVVLVTGDITDAKYKDYLGSQQYVEEWESYHQILKETRVAESIPWLDVRGNHDAFNVPALDDSKNLFRVYSSRGAQNSRSYLYTHKLKAGGNISFIALDSCPDPGPRRPFNFFGVLTKDDMNNLSKLKEEAKHSNLTFWFGHYPTSTIWTPYPGVQKTLSDSIYMNGHLHSFLGIIPSMYALQPEGMLELELGDWKDNRVYRIFAVDHGLFSFTDEVLDQWPVILITNPKNTQFSMPVLEPTGRIKHSTHIRFLAFSPWRIKSTSVSIDGLELDDVQQIEGPIYAAPWKTSLLSDDVHIIKVTIEDEKGNQRTVTQPFSFNNSKKPFMLMARYVLMVNHHLMFQCLFWLSFICAVMPLVILRFLNIQFEVTTVGKSWRGCLVRYLQMWVRRLSLVANTPSLFYLLIGFDIYIAVGPWFIGELIDGYIGVAFLHGLYVNGGFIPGTLTYLYGYCQMITFNIPLTLYLGCVKDWSLSDHKHRETTNASTRHTGQTSLVKWISQHGFLVLLLIFQAYLAYSGYYKAYGLIVLLLCPVRTWSVPFAVYLHYIALKTAEMQHRHLHS